MKKLILVFTMIFSIFTAMDILAGISSRSANTGSSSYRSSSSSYRPSVTQNSYRPTSTTNYYRPSVTNNPTTFNTAAGKTLVPSTTNNIASTKNVSNNTNNTTVVNNNTTVVHRDSYVPVPVVVHDDHYNNYNTGYRPASSGCY